jgi:hypothetical protein
MNLHSQRSRQQVEEANSFSEKKERSIRTQSVGALRRRVNSREYPTEIHSNRDSLYENKAPSAIHEKVVATLRREKDNIQRAFSSQRGEL